ncbi:hypothetical protein AgCh_017596 [Apium graveolens]
MLEHGRGKVLETVVKIQDMHDAAKEIEKSLLELRQVFWDMAVKPEASTMDNNKAKGGGSIGLSYPTLTKNNYTSWALKMKVYLQAQGVWITIEPNDPKSTVEEKTDSRKGNRKTGLGRIENHVPRSGMCEEGKSANSKKALGESMNESYVVKKLLRAVPSKFLHIVSTIEKFGDLETMTLEEAVGSLKAHEERLKGIGKTESNEGQLMLTEEEWEKREISEGKLLLTREDWLRREQNEKVNMTRLDDDEPALLLAKSDKEEQDVAYLNEKEVVPS